MSSSAVKLRKYKNTAAFAVVAVAVAGAFLYWRKRSLVTETENRLSEFEKRLWAWVKRLGGWESRIKEIKLRCPLPDVLAHIDDAMAPREVLRIFDMKGNLKRRVQGLETSVPMGEATMRAELPGSKIIHHHPYQQGGIPSFSVGDMVVMHRYGVVESNVLCRYEDELYYTRAYPKMVLDEAGVLVMQDKLLAADSELRSRAMKMIRDGTLKSRMECFRWQMAEWTKVISEYADVELYVFKDGLPVGIAHV